MILIRSILSEVRVEVERSQSLNKALLLSLITLFVHSLRKAGLAWMFVSSHDALLSACDTPVLLPVCVSHRCVCVWQLSSATAQSAPARLSVRDLWLFQSTAHICREESLEYFQKSESHFVVLDRKFHWFPLALLIQTTKQPARRN